ncbi:hypothetical protein H4R20_001816 [Coemansia guatemalensis]|uniref:Phospholipase n=1 Tax=Coemansia guatemalensis TaxID=2761395 RepID=A0A9W8LVB0_9FUNG|nr:hypothetical protein H4R20_001816 [Coemansia guatemalensis]
METHSISEVPVSPLVAASTAGEHYPAQRLSYAHQQNVSGWDKLFENISQRAESCADELNHEVGADGNLGGREKRVPAMGEDTNEHGDVQYVYESDDQYNLPHAAGPHRSRAGTGFSSTGSGMQMDHGSVGSTTALSPTTTGVNGTTGTNGTMARSLAALAGRTHRDTNGGVGSYQSQSHDRQDDGDASPSHPSAHVLAARFLNQINSHLGDDESSKSNGHEDAERETSERVAREEGTRDGEDEDADADADAPERHTRREDLRAKLKRAVIKASVITRKGGRHMKSAGAQGVFPFLQDAMFVPMFHFMRDEHGHRAAPVIFDAIQLSVNMPGTEPEVDEDEHHFVARIALQYGDVKWVIQRRLNDFLSLHTMLTLRRFQGRVHQLPAFPHQLGYALEKARSLKPGHGTLIGGSSSGAGGSWRMQQATADRRQALETYLLKLLRALNMRPAYELCTFLELSAVSIMKDVGWKGKEGNLDRRVEHTTGIWCTPHDLRRWTRQWVLVRDSFIAFCNHVSDAYPTDVLFADAEFDMRLRKKTGHNPLFPHRLTVSNQYRRIQLRSDSERVINEWWASISAMKNSSAWAVPHRFASFAPIRDDSRVIWFVDGDDYFYALSEALENATDVIYIGDWWLSPELHLRRPPSQHEEYRLDRLLKRKAEEGVKIYVYVYKEVTVSLTINSSYTKRKLQSLHPNIMVQRHPDHLAGGTMFWAHHEKMTIVDNTFAFIGGLDLCWGRYDTHGHRLADYYLPHSGRGFVHLQNYFGQDYNNARIHDFANVNDYESTLIDRRMTPRMPWHDVHMAMIGQPARDVARHFIQRWNFIKSSKGMSKPKLPFLMPKGEYSATRNDLQYRGTCRTQVLRSSAEWSLGISKESSIHTAYCEMIRDAKHFVYIENQFFVSNAREDPAHTIKNRIAEALVDRIRRAHAQQAKFRVIIVIPLMPAFEGDVNAVGAATLKLVMHWQYQSICRGDHSIAAQLERDGIDMHDYIRFFGLRNYDVIRRYADATLARNAAAAAGNAPREATGFDEMLQREHVPPIARRGSGEDSGDAEASVLAGATESQGSARQGSVRVELPPPSPPAGRPETVANTSVRSQPRSLAGSSRSHAFLRPDEAFVEDMLPMQDNPVRNLQENARRSQEHARRSQDRHASAKQPRRSLNLPQRPFMRQRSSFSGLRGFLGGSDTRPGDRSASRSRAASLTTSSSSSSDEDEYMPRVDEQGRRRNAFRYLVRGTEHIKQYGRQRRKRDKGLQQRIHKPEQGDASRDSDSEFGTSGSSRDSERPMHVDMADVENYVHPQRSLPHDASSFLRTQQPSVGRPGVRSGLAVLPEDTGTEYVRERTLADQQLPAEANRRSSPVAYSGSASAQKPQDAANSYPPPLPRAGPQVLEHHVFGTGAGAGEGASAKQQTPRQLQSQPTAPAALGTSQADDLNKPGPTGETAEEQEAEELEAEVLDQIVTELVYVHCKLMIVDDRYVVMGSANINDRSMCGNRDSEIAMVVEDTEPVVTTMDGRPYQAAKFAHSLRVQLCQEHCGLLETFDQMRYVNEAFAGAPPMDTSRSEAELLEMKRARKTVEDPLADAFWDMWWDTASNNARIFREVFRCVPDDTVETFDQYKKFIPGHNVPYGHALPDRSTAETLQMLKGVRGHLVPQPLNFLKYENLGAKLGDKEILVPIEVFT